MTSDMDNSTKDRSRIDGAKNSSEQEPAVSSPSGTVSSDIATSEPVNAIGGGAAPVDLPKLDILVADDYHLNQKVISVILRNLGHRTYLADNGLEAVSALLRSRFDLVLMDIGLTPSLDAGFNVYSRGTLFKTC
ncbi:MAG: hypothetical protein OSB82_07105 [Alphaproteobacteria bacterium]|nr:hypothetical protein [Alphaproteobacteria bacterium]